MAQCERQKLKFSLEDITYILVRNEDEIEEIWDTVVEVGGGKMTPAVKSCLTTLITPLDLLQEDI